MKLKKSVKDIHQSGVNHVGLEMEFSKALDKLGDTVLTRDDEEDDIGAAFQKFAVVTKEMAALMKNMVRFQTLKWWIRIFIKSKITNPSYFVLKEVRIKFEKIYDSFTMLVVNKIVLRVASPHSQCQTSKFT